jgi:hypothetical protein
MGLVLNFKEVFMKAKATGFDPITIELVIESKQDLADLWHRLNVGVVLIDQHSDDVTPDWRASFVSTSLWQQLDDIARERGFIE